MSFTTFETFRQVTGWKRPIGNHGCKPVEVIPGVWTAHYHDMDSREKLAIATNNAPIALVVNSALCQCEARTGFFGPNIRVMEIDLEDDTGPRKNFDAGKPNVQSDCGDSSVGDKFRCAGDAKKSFDLVCDEMENVLTKGGHVMLHCHASISRSAAFILAYMMRNNGMTLLEAGVVMKAKWDATWPCDRFCFQLIEYEKELEARRRQKYALVVPPISLVGIIGLSTAVGFLIGTLSTQKQNK